MSSDKSSRQQAELSNRPKSRILVVNDHPIIRETLVLLINNQPDMQVCGSVSDGKGAFREALILKPEIALVDLSAGGENGTEFIRAFSTRFPDMGIIVMSMRTELFYAERAFKAGARGFIVKGGSSQDMLRAVRSVLAGRIYFSGS